MFVAEELREDFFEIISAQRDTAPEMKPKSFFRGIIADSVAKPQNKTELKKALKNMCVIRGSGTTFTSSILPHEGETIISTGAMDSLSIKKNIATVGAGVPFYRLIAEARKNNLEVPCYPMSYHAATIGGFIANHGIIGFNSRGTGYFIDYVEEMEVVTSSGTTFKVRGTDLADFFGSEGTLGVITQVKLKLLEKETRYIHMYGFDGMEDFLKFLEMNDDVYAAYIMNDTALHEYEETLQLKHVTKLAAIIIDKNWKDDYKKELRTDLAQQGISHIYPKNVLKFCFKRIGKLEPSIMQEKDAVHIADGVVVLDDAVKALRIADQYELPFFANVGKEEMLYRLYFNCGNWMKRQKFMSIMDKAYTFSEPNCVGSFFREQSQNSSRDKRLTEALGKYDTKQQILPRIQLYASKKARRFVQPLLMFSGRMW
jgi:hypothetical protein